MDKVRVVLVDDSSTVRALLRALLEADAGIEVVGEAADGRAAVELVRTLRPNVVSMDLEMPVMGGLDAIAEIMSTKAVPILVVSDVADQNAYEAVRRGALDIIAKPEPGSPSAGEFAAKLKLLAAVPVITHLRARSTGPAASAASPPPPVLRTTAPGVPDSAAWRRVIAVASSTGGPQALAQILPGLPADFAAPLLIAQHISDGFAAGMVDWLGKLCRLPVRLGREGEAVRGGTIYVSPSEAHMTVTAAGMLAMRPRAAGDIYHPSCDALLESAAAFGKRAVGVILTGMGHDGAEGLNAIRRAGGITIAQDEASSVIYGMNGVAVGLGAAQRVLPVGEIAPALCRLAASEGST